MTNSKQLIAMIRSHGAGDSEQFLSIAEHIANDADKSGKTRVAVEIRDIVTRIKNEAAKRRGAPAIPMIAPRGELAGLVRASYPEVRLSDVVLGNDLRRRDGLVPHHRPFPSECSRHRMFVLELFGGNQKDVVHRVETIR